MRSGTMPSNHKADPLPSPPDAAPAAGAIPLGHVAAIVRYPVKSMAGTPIDSAFLGWHGLEGDRRFAFRRPGDTTGFPWLTASRLPELILYHPHGLDPVSDEPLPTAIRTPSGALLPLRSATLQDEVTERFGSPVELMGVRNGIFDDAPVSLITLATVAGVCAEAGVPPDPRRFRANIVLATHDATPFAEDGWVGGTLAFGDEDSGAALTIPARDVRCMMINLDPETAVQDAAVMKAVVRLNDQHAGVYGTVVRTGTIRVGQPVRVHDA